MYLSYSMFLIVLVILVLTSLALKWPSSLTILIFSNESTMSSMIKEMKLNLLDFNKTLLSTALILSISSELVCNSKCLIK